MAAVTHFSMIGFQINSSSSEAMGAELISLSQSCPTVTLSGADRLCVVRDKTGAEIWIGLTERSDGQLEIRTVNPALQGRGSASVEVTLDISPAEWRPFEYRIQAQLGGEVPFAVDLADPNEVGSFKQGAKLRLDITAFAEELSVYPSEDAYDASQKTQKIKFDPHHFIPSGMFVDESGTDKTPRAEAIFAGDIMAAELRENDVGKSKYWWLLVRTFDGAVINVVADPATLKAQPIVGGIAAGSFWLSARLAKN